MLSQEITIVNRLGLHARAAAQLVRMATEYPCDIRLEKDGQVSDAKSVMEVLMLGAPVGTSIKVSTDGEKEEEALRAIVSLFEASFHELE